MRVVMMVEVADPFQIPACRIFTFVTIILIVLKEMLLLLYNTISC